MLAGGAGRIAAMAVIGSTQDICTPCGACRQRIREFASPGMRIGMFSADGGEMLIQTMEELLPHSFGPDHLPPA
ncbi:MAG: cytidine deaminase, partial [Beijerinckiaceae bacterium]